jgi:hypothetical protein
MSTSQHQGETERRTMAICQYARARQRNTCAWRLALGISPVCAPRFLHPALSRRPTACLQFATRIRCCRPGSALLRADISVGGWWRHRASRNQTNLWARTPGNVRLLAFALFPAILRPCVRSSMVSKRKTVWSSGSTQPFFNLFKIDILKFQKSKKNLRGCSKLHTLWLCKFLMWNKLYCSLSKKKQIQ